jgi:hypothetical protein
MSDEVDIMIFFEDFKSRGMGDFTGAKEEYFVFG